MLGVIALLVALPTAARAASDEDGPLTAGAQRAIDRYEAAVARLQEQLAKDLDKEIAYVLHIDNEKSLAYANAIKAKKAELCGAAGAPAGLAILSARYVYGNDALDVTAYFRKKVVAGHLRYLNNDSLWKEVGDPHPGTPKDVVITYRVDHGEAKTVTARTGETIAIP